jgi:hypothetical protein
MLLWGRLLMGWEREGQLLICDDCDDDELVPGWMLDVAEHICMHQLSTLLISVMGTFWLVDSLR